MTGAEFRRRFRLVNTIAVGATRNDRVLDATGREAMAHFMGTGDAAAARAERVQRLGDPARGQVRAVLEVDGIPVVVTQSISGFTDFDSWLSEAEAAGATASPAPPAPPAAAAPPSPAPVPATEQPTQLLRPEVPPPVESAPPSAAKAPGQFTAILGAPSGAAPAPASTPSAQAGCGKNGLIRIAVVSQKTIGLSVYFDDTQSRLLRSCPVPGMASIQCIVG